MDAPAIAPKAAPPPTPETVPARPLSPFAAAAVVLGALSAGTGVVLGAWAAHGLPAAEGRLVATASGYALWHGLALIGAALVRERLRAVRPALWLATLAACLFVVGIVLFCGGVIGVATGHAPHTAPVGGTALILGWAALALAALAALVIRPRA